MKWHSFAFGVVCGLVVATSIVGNLTYPRVRDRAYQDGRESCALEMRRKAMVYDRDILKDNCHEYLKGMAWEIENPASCQEQVEWALQGCEW